MERKSAIKKAPPMKIPNKNKGTTRKSTSESEEPLPPRMNPFTIRENQKKRKRLPGTNILLEIQTLQERPDSIIPQASFRRLVNEICEDNFDEKFRWTALSMKALQYSAEEYMVGLFEDSYLCSMHCKRVTLLSQDLQLARRIRGPTDAGNR